MVSEQGNVICIKELQVKKTVALYLRTQPVCSAVSLIWDTKIPKLKEICKYLVDTCVYKITSMPILIPWFLWLHTCQWWSRLDYIIIKETVQTSAPSCISVGRTAKPLLCWDSNIMPNLSSEVARTAHGASYPCSTAGTPPQTRQLCPCQHCHPSADRERVPIDEASKCQWQRHLMDLPQVW